MREEGREHERSAKRERDGGGESVKDDERETERGLKSRNALTLET